MEKKSKIPEAPTPLPTSGNLLSSVAPPSELPNFVTSASPVKIVPPHTSAQPTPVPVVPVQVASQPLSQSTDDPQSWRPPDNFSPAIPLSKGEPMQCVRSPEVSDTTDSTENDSKSEPDGDKLDGDIMPGSGLFNWMMGAVPSGGMFRRVAEKAKNSVDSMITTLDPQMKEYLNSGGDMYIVVASDKEVKISPIRQAFQAIFGKATVEGFEAQSDVTAAQPVGCAAAYAAAKQRIAHVRSTRTDLTNNVPVVAVEGFLHEAISDRWYDISLMVLSQPSLGIELQIQSQGTPVPLAAIHAVREATSPDYPHSQTGYSLTIGSVMADNLQVLHTQWQEATTGVSRAELLLLAAKSLAGSYKKLLAISAAES